MTRDTDRSKTPAFRTSVEDDPQDDALADQWPGAAITCDYLASGGAGRRRTFQASGRTVHHPGTLAGLTPDQSGSHGFSLVEFDATGSARCRMIVAAPVRWEVVRLELDADCDGRRLAALMGERLSALPMEPAERLCGLTWHIVACPALAAELSCPHARKELLSRVAGESTAGVTFLHRLLVDVSSHGLADELEPITADDVLDSLAQITAICQQADEVVSSVAAGIDLRQVEREARRLAATVLPESASVESGL